MVFGSFFGGGQKTSGTTSTTSTPNVPQWYKDYLQSNIGDIKSYTDANRGLTSDQAIVDFTPDELAAFERARGLTGKYDPILDQSLSTLQQVQQRVIQGSSNSQPFNFNEQQQQPVTRHTHEEKAPVACVKLVG